MAFSLPATRPGDEQPAELVRAAAGRLVDDLARARRLTGGWSDEPLGDALVDDALGRCMATLETSGCRGEANRTASTELWRVAGELLEKGSLQRRARFKPRGYAGDYEMLTRICQQSCCEDPLGAAFDRYFLRQAAPAAVRTRTRQTAAALASLRLESTGSDFHVSSVGCGPAIDIAQGLAILPEDRRRGVRVTLLDLDPDALDAAQSRVEPLLPDGNLECICTNLFRLAGRPDASAALGQSDLLICSGLFDYLADDAARAMLDLFWRQLTEGGSMLVGNFAPHTPTRSYMEWIGNWYLIYRTAEQFHQLGLGAGIPARRLAIGCEPLGVDLFLVAKRG